MHRLTREVSITSFVANNLLLPAPKEEISGMLQKQEDYHFMSIQLNLMNTFLYMVLEIHFLTCVLGNWLALLQEIILDSEYSKLMLHNLLRATL